MFVAIFNKISSYATLCNMPISDFVVLLLITDTWKFRKLFSF